MKMQRRVLGFVMIATLSTSALTQAVTINEFLPATLTPTPGTWILSDMRENGTATIADLTGLGGDLENNQPLPTGAALLTTGLSNADKAEVGTFDDFGDAATVLGTIDLGYNYYKQTVAGGNVAAAPAMKIALFAFGGTGDNFGQLVYEPTWNGGPTADAWQAEAIDSSTGGGGNDATGGWWWTGGFEIGGSPGPPIRSLDEWVTAFQASDPTDFATARMVGVSIGVGTFNQGQIGYVDNVSIAIPGGTNVTYNFQAIPEPGTIALSGIGLLGWFASRRRRLR